MLRGFPPMHRGIDRVRLTLLATALTTLIAAPLAFAQADRLPDIGSSAGELLTPARQQQYGAMTLRELRNYGYLLDDPLIDDWLDRVGGKLAANSDRPSQPFTFFMLRDRQINAFATLGGYIAVNSGLVLTAEREDEVAAVLSHEIAHVTQQHVLRSVERAQRDQIPILLGMLGAIIAAQAAGGHSSGDATQAAVVSGMGLMQQRQIDYTRSNESEADRIGIQTLARAGYDPDAMAGFFSRMDQAMRANKGGERERTPDYLQTHPVTSSRISEAHDRAERIKREKNVITTVSTPGGKIVESSPREGDYAAGARSNNPLLPFQVTLPPASFDNGATGLFQWAKERLRVLSANTPDQAIREYESIRRSTGELSEAQQYGLALAQLRNNQPGAAVAALTQLLQRAPGNQWLGIGLAEAQARAGDVPGAKARFKDLMARTPNSRAVALGYAQVLNGQGDRAGGQQAQAVLQPLLDASAQDPIFQQAYARACELAGDSVRAGEAYAQVAYLNGRPEQALTQLSNLKKREALDYYARARIDARIAAITPEVLALRDAGVKDPDLDRNR
ncbi:putative Zn-dependent protease [Pseudoxanthomonas sp. SORGH_AS 997]|uniref:Putative beta-barrel assembly-enhancing protease n=2 Tax=Lysobacteraceae TaxID=32033 RepID=A0AAW8GF51_9GAMM|nr:putative Zn-dependent protease [Pseudoxanthomonas winnipegensis]MDQ1132946.1 putative Zn-dependent protease [Pseudoxanthomonas winnipegensis]MDR6137049.1 putative Zn-dependent protease [Pseudoxanthomonas sp. SORGH_AS_0997]